MDRVELCFFPHRRRRRRQRNAHEVAFMGGSHTWCLCFTAVLDLPQKWRPSRGWMTGGKDILDEKQENGTSREPARMGLVSYLFLIELLFLIDVSFSFLSMLMLLVWAGVSYTINHTRIQSSQHLSCSHVSCFPRWR